MSLWCRAQNPNALRHSSTTMRRFRRVAGACEPGLSYPPHQTTFYCDGHRVNLILGPSPQRHWALGDVDRRFWILARRWFSGWRRSLLIVTPETVLCWHRKGWKSYWRWRSRWSGNTRRGPLSVQIRLLIRRMTLENARRADVRCSPIAVVRG